MPDTTPVSQPAAPPARIVVTDVQIPFWDLVSFFIRAAVALVPAVIILGIILMVIYYGVPLACMR